MYTGDQVDNAYYDVDHIINNQVITHKDQILNFKFKLNKTSPIEGFTFEQAYLQLFDYVSVLIQNRTIIVEDNVFISMLNEDYCNLKAKYSLPFYYLQYCRDNNFCGEVIYNKDLIKYSLNNYYQVLNSEQTDKIEQYLEKKYGSISYPDIDDMTWQPSRHTVFQGKTCILWFYVDGLEKNILIDRNGTIFDDDYAKLRIINDDLILYEKRECIHNTKIEHYIRSLSNKGYYYRGDYKYYPDIYECGFSKVSEQGIINYKGVVQFKGIIGELDSAIIERQFIIFVKPRYSFFEREKINYYIYEVQNKISDCCWDYKRLDEYEKDYKKCPFCGSKEIRWPDYILPEHFKYWKHEFPTYKVFLDDEDYEIDSGYCDNCNKYFITKLQQLASDHFDAALSTITDDKEEFINYLIEIQNNDIKYENVEEDYYNYVIDSSVLLSNHLTHYLEEKLYALFSTQTKMITVPFQPYTIHISNDVYPLKIYLIDELMKEHDGQLYKSSLSKRRSKNVTGYPTPVVRHIIGNIIYPGAIDCHIFYTILDSFRFGPLTGITLSQAFRRNYKTLIKYITQFSIFLSMPALEQLHRQYYRTERKKLNTLICCRDLIFNYEDINSLSDPIIAYTDKDSKTAGFFYKGNGAIIGKHIITDKSWFDGKKFDYVLKNSPIFIYLLLRHNQININTDLIDIIEKSYNKPIYKAISQLINDQYEKRNQYYDDNILDDFERDNWNALTDGQYGDMPDGFDGDYDKFGF